MVAAGGSVDSGCFFLRLFLLRAHVCMCAHGGGGGQQLYAHVCEFAWKQKDRQTNVGAILMKASTSFEAGSYWSGARQLD